MMIRHLAATAAAALLIGAFVPVSAASAADATLTGALSGDSGPEAGLVIGWVEADDFTNVETTTSGSSGEYSLDIPDDIGDYLLFTNLTVQPNGVGEVVNPGYTGEFFGQADARAFLSSLVEPYPAPVSGPLDITLTPAGSISGTSDVFAGDQLALTTLGNNEVASTTVGDDGSFEFDALYPGDYRVTGSHYGYTHYRSQAVTVTAGSDTGVAIAVQPDSGISGVVKNGDTPLKGIEVQAYSLLDTDFPIDTVTTGSNGAYAFPHLQPGDFTVSFTSYPGSASNSFVAKTVSVPDVVAGEERKVDVRLSSAGIITGRVTKPAGATVYMVRAYDSSGRFAGQAAGSKWGERFVIGGLTAGSYTVNVTESTKKYYDSRVVTVKTRKSTSIGTRSPAKKTATLSGAVTGASGGFVTVSLGSRGIAETAISSSGKYKVAGLVPATYTVSTIATDTEKRSIRVKISATRTKALTPGVPFGEYTGTALVNGDPVQGLGGYSTRNSGYSPFEFDDGFFHGAGRAGPATLLRLTAVDLPLPARSPYWYDFPAPAKSFTLTSGETTALGTFELELHGGEE